jgi:hypothetical protein
MARFDDDEGGRVFRTIEQMQKECDRLNAHPCWIELERWHRVVPATESVEERDGNPAQPSYPAFIQTLTGKQAIYERAMADGTWKARYKPEPGETEWTGRAVAQYRQEFPECDPLTSQKDKTHFRDVINRWAASKPWAHYLA